MASRPWPTPLSTPRSSASRRPPRCGSRSKSDATAARTRSPRGHPTPPNQVSGLYLTSMCPAQRDAEQHATNAVEALESSRRGPRALVRRKNPGSCRQSRDLLVLDEEVGNKRSPPTSRARRAPAQQPRASVAEPTMRQTTIVTPDATTASSAGAVAASRAPATPQVWTMLSGAETRGGSAPGRDDRPTRA